jgi:hypothetical protein
VRVEITAPQRMEDDEIYDGVQNYARAFMKSALLLRDVHDAYKMGDGNRVYRNIKFLMLHFDRGHNIKYRIWMFRMLAYDLALLSDYERHKYRNNIAINLVGGVRECLPNDNLVEITVHKIKECMRAMGANLTYNAARRSAKCLGTVNNMVAMLASMKSGEHAATNTEKDVSCMVKLLHQAQVFSHVAGREHGTFPNFPSDLLNDVNLVESNNWLTSQKLRASREMQM